MEFSIKPYFPRFMKPVPCNYFPLCMTHLRPFKHTLSSTFTFVQKFETWEQAIVTHFKLGFLERQPKQPVSQERFKPGTSKTEVYDVNIRHYPTNFPQLINCASNTLTSRFWSSFWGLQILVNAYGLHLLHIMRIYSLYIGGNSFLLNVETNSSCISFLFLT